MDSPRERTVAAVVVTYNRRALLERCLTALESQSRRPDLIIVVDNDSDDGTQEYLNDRDRSVPDQVLRLPRNLGGAMGFAVGTRAALLADVDSVWLLDDDAIADEQALEWLLSDRAAAEAVGRTPAFLCSAVVWRDGSAAAMNIPRAASTWNATGLLADRPVIDVDTASFVSVLIPAAHVRAVGLPYADYFKWFDDTEYTLRLSKRFGPGLYSSRSVVRHLTKANDGALPWMATDDDVVHHARALRNRVSAAITVRDPRTLLAATRDAARVARTTDLPLGRRARLISGYLSGFGYRPRLRQLP